MTLKKWATNCLYTYNICNIVIFIIRILTVFYE